MIADPALQALTSSVMVDRGRQYSGLLTGHRRTRIPQKENDLARSDLSTCFVTPILSRYFRAFKR